MALLTVTACVAPDKRGYVIPFSGVSMSVSQLSDLNVAIHGA